MIWQYTSIFALNNIQIGQVIFKTCITRCDNKIWVYLSHFWAKFDNSFFCMIMGTFFLGHDRSQTVDGCKRPVTVCMWLYGLQWCGGTCWDWGEDGCWPVCGHFGQPLTTKHRGIWDYWWGVHFSARQWPQTHLQESQKLDGREQYHSSELGSTVSRP